MTMLGLHELPELRPDPKPWRDLWRLSRDQLRHYRDTGEITDREYSDEIARRWLNSSSHNEGD